MVWASPRAQEREATPVPDQRTGITRATRCRMAALNSAEAEPGSIE